MCLVRIVFCACSVRDVLSPFVFVLALLTQLPPGNGLLGFAIASICYAATPREFTGYAATTRTDNTVHPAVTNGHLTNTNTNIFQTKTYAHFGQGPNASRHAGVQVCRRPVARACRCAVVQAGRRAGGQAGACRRANGRVSAVVRAGWASVHDVALMIVPSGMRLLSTKRK